MRKIKHKRNVLPWIVIVFLIANIILCSLLLVVNNNQEVIIQVQDTPIKNKERIALHEMNIIEQEEIEHHDNNPYKEPIVINNVDEQIEEQKIEQTTELKFQPYDIPLSEELQIYTYDLCQERNIDFEIVLALMYSESTFRIDIVSKTNDSGLMQINKCNHKWLSEELGITDFLDGEQNINAGTYMLSEFYNKYPDVHKMLMAYNYGEGGARKAWDNGVYSSEYSRMIVSIAEKIKKGVTDWNTN